MIHVRRHKRQTASGKTTTVRAHEREGGDGVSEAPGWAQSASASDFAPAPAGNAWQEDDDMGDWWDAELEGSEELTREAPAPQHDPSAGVDALTLMKEDMQHWRALPEPGPGLEGFYGDPEPMTPQMEKLLGCDTPEGRARYDRGRAYREAGYDGPLDSDNRIPDPDDPANHESLSALAHMRRNG